MFPAARRVIPSGTPVGLIDGSVKNSPLPMPMKTVRFGVAGLPFPADSDTRSWMPSLFKSTNRAFLGGEASGSGFGLAGGGTSPSLLGRKTPRLEVAGSIAAITAVRPLLSNRNRGSLPATHG